MEKSVPRDHRLSSLGKPRDAKQRSSGRICLSYPHVYDRFLYYSQVSALNFGLSGLMNHARIKKTPTEGGGGPVNVLVNNVFHRMWYKPPLRSNWTPCLRGQNASQGRYVLVFLR